MGLAAACQPQRSYDVRGRVVGFGDDSTRIIVAHEAIPGLMPAMTMPFRAAAARAIAGLQYGDEIQFRLHVTSEESWVDDVRALSPGDPPLELTDRAFPDTSFGASTPLVPGNMLPPVTLVDQDSTAFSLSDLRGRVVVMTFIYTRCPLPDYCPLMSERLNVLQQFLIPRYGDRVHLLSVTLDPKFDTPAVLRRYAARYTPEHASWTYATGSREEIDRLTDALGLTVVRQGATIDHSLATVVIDPAGRISAVWRGNQWLPDDVAARVEYLLGQQQGVS